MSSLISNRHNELIPVYIGYLNASINSTFSLHTQGNMRKLCDQQAKLREIINLKDRNSDQRFKASRSDSRYTS